MMQETAISNSEAVRNLDSSTYDEAESLPEFLRAEPEEYGEYIHAVQLRDERKLVLYRSMKPIGERKSKLKYVIENVRFRFSMTSDDDWQEPSHWYLTSGEAETLLTFLDSYKGARGDASMSVRWYKTNNSPLIDETNIDQESLILQWSNGSRSYTTHIDSMYQVPSQMMARF